MRVRALQVNRERSRQLHSGVPTQSDMKTRNRNGSRDGLPWLISLRYDNEARAILMKSMHFSLVANVAAVFLTGSILDAGDQNGRGSSLSEAASVTRAIQDFMAAVARDVTAQGPHAWRKYLSHKSSFFMASNGQLVFESGEAAQQGVGALEQSIEHISL